jgi:uncharacterized lipoprotein YehR (DUF1307 family)
MKNTLLSLLILFSLSGCQDKREDQAKHDAKIAQEARAQLIKEQEEAKKMQEELEEKSKYSQIGITSKEGKIIIDTNKTKEYFRGLAYQVKSKMDKMSKDLERGIIKNEEAGIEMDETHINIDLNKTKTFLEAWGKKMQGFVREFDEVAKEINGQNKTIKDADAAN